jgi:hypothetical protein
MHLLHPLTPRNAGSIPAEGILQDFAAVLKPTDGEHIVQKFGPKLLIEETDKVAQGFFEYSRCTSHPPSAHSVLHTHHPLRPKSSFLFGSRILATYFSPSFRWWTDPVVARVVF